MADILRDLSSFVATLEYDDLPREVVNETVRIILDSVGCGLAGNAHRRGAIGVEYGHMLGGNPQATILGSSQKVSVASAAFANAELINALDHDAVLPPGHVAPYVLPGAMATAETLSLTGRDLILATAIAHETSYRFGKAMDNHRDIRNGKTVPLPVWGFASTIFGATAAISKLHKQSKEVIGHALSLAAIISPVNSAASWREHLPPTTIKYLLGGQLAQSALNAAHMASLGHLGDASIFDPEFGYPRFIGTQRWEPDGINEGLGAEWLFPRESSFKPYPHCRILHAPLDALTEIVETHDLRPEEIDEIVVWVEGFVERPLWMNRTITDVTDAQFSIAHGMALGAHRLPSGPLWQDPKHVFAPSVLALMDKVRHVVHPDYAASLAQDGRSRPTRVEIQARGEVFRAERSHPKGTGRVGDPTYLSTEELTEKFIYNASFAIPNSQAGKLSDSLVALADVEDVSWLMSLARPE